MSRPEPSARVWKLLAVLAAVHSRGQIDDDVADAYASDLAAYPEPLVLHALDRCRRELRTFPTIADIISRIDDGRPGAEEAWAMIPKDEAGSVVWSTEMRDAFAVARSLLADDPVAARMAFRETYVKLVTDARARQTPTAWIPSLGHGVEERSQAVQFALERGRLSADQAKRLLPDGETERRIALPAPAEEVVPKADLNQISSILGKILNNAPESVQRLERVRRTYQGAEPVEPTADQIEIRKRQLLEQARIIDADSSNQKGST